MLTPVPPTDCMQAREAVSLRLDGDLSELEAVRLGLHLRDCADCRAYARDIAAITLELRSAPLEQMRVQTFVPRPKRASGLRLQAAAAAAVAFVAAVAGTSFAIGRAVGTGGQKPTFTATAAGTDGASARADSTQQHVLALLRGTEQPTVPATGRVIPL